MLALLFSVNFGGPELGDSQERLIRAIRRDSLDYPDYEVLDTPEPKLYKELFPFESPPKIHWDGVVVPQEIPDQLWITDTTFRDGQQSRDPYTVEQIMDLYKFLNRIGGPKGKILMTECFLYTKRDREAVSSARALGLKYPIISGWIRASREDLKLAKEAKLEEVGMLSSISDYHIFYKFKGLSRSQVISKYLEVIEEGLKSGIVMRAHIEDCTRSDILGVVVPFVKKLMRLSDKYDLPVKVRIPDTLGLGVPWPQAALPRSIPKIVWILRHIAGVPSEWLEFHGHNDFHMGIANATAAWMYGASLNNTTLFGIGERAGNVPLEAMVFMYAALKGTLDDMDTLAITEVARYYRRVIGYHIPSYYPIVGKNFNITRAGIHADGALKNIEMYLPFDTEKLLGVPPGVSITPYSGNAGVAFWINYYFNLKNSEKVDKDHPGVLKIYQDVLKRFEEGEALTISDKEMLLLVKKHMPEFFDKNKNRINPL
ncbi:MAG: 2-isopropylmalate synthase [Candidatus Methanomethyliales bacterium]|nr:2-isopropylmalate synthase [Candidatus Methanomethylicales archaeon]